MSNLDDKLREIHDAIWGRALDSITEDFRKPDGRVDEVAYQQYKINSAVESINQIRKAFAEDASMSVALPLMMTGQEWYDRFDKEMTKASDIWWDGGNGFVLVGNVRGAAKRAAGLEDKNG